MSLRLWTAWPFVAALLLFALKANAQLGWPTGVVKHAFFPTKNGQIHYVTRGDVQKPGTIVYFHGHPRSTAEFKHVLANLGDDVNFMAFDFFGMGMSEDFSGTDGFCKIEVFAKYALQVIDSHSLSSFVPAGWLKGVNAAIELAALAGPSRVSNIIVMGPLFLSPANMDFIEHKLIPMLKNPELKADGSHLITAWGDASDSDPEFPADLVDNQEKTNDELRCLYTGWQYQAAWVAYNNRCVKRLSYVDSFAKSLIVTPILAHKEWGPMGLDVQFSENAMAKALVHGNNRTVEVLGTEGMLTQNATLVASLIADFLGHSQGLPLIVA